MNRPTKAAVLGGLYALICLGLFLLEWAKEHVAQKIKELSSPPSGQP